MKNQVNGASLRERAFLLKNRSALRALTSGLAILVSCGAAMQAQAQDDSQAQGAEDSTPVLNPIIVTAQKRSENLQDVPIAVSAFDGEALQSRGILGGNDLEQVVPNVSFEGDTGFGAYNFQIRGVGAQIEGVAADTGVGAHVNNVPVTVSRFTQSEFYDMERIEVLRGPQGTLYGRNATGGVVNLITAKPEYDFSGKIALDYGNYDARRITGHLNVPLSDTLAVRFAGFLLKRDGTHFNTETGNDVETKDIWSGRVSIGWEPDDSFSANLVYEHFEQDDTTGGSRKLVCASDPGPTSVGGVPTDSITRLTLSASCLNTPIGDPRNNGAIVTGAAFGGIFANLGGISSLDALAGRTYSSDPYTVSSTNDPFTIAKNDLVSLSLTYEISDTLTLTSLSSYSYDDAQASWAGTQASGPNTERFAPTPFNPGGVVVDPILGNFDFLVSDVFTDQNAEQWTQELRLQSDFDGPFNFNIGGIYLDLERENKVYVTSNSFTHFANVLNATTFAGGPQIAIDQGSFPHGSGRNYLNVTTDYRLEALAFFGEGYYDVSDDVKVTLGLRYTEDRKTNVNAPIGFLTPGSGIPAGATTQHASFKELTGRFTVDWKATDDMLVYASAARGYKGGGFNPEATITGFPEKFDPEFINALELGMKSSVFDGRGTLNLNGFYYDYAGYQISRIQNNSIITENVDAEIYGLELETAFAVTDSFTLNANVGYLNTAVADGVTSIDVYDRTQGNPDFTAVNSFSPAAPGGGCILPTAEVAGLLAAINAGLAPPQALGVQCAGAPASPAGPAIPPSPNALAGIPADLSGNSLPEAPTWTIAAGAQYDLAISTDWDATLRADYSYRSKRFGRVFNAVIDELDDLHNVNLSLQIMNDPAGLEFQFYVRNLLSDGKIVNSQATGETPGSYRIVRASEPVIYGIRVTKSF